MGFPSSKRGCRPDEKAPNPAGQGEGQADRRRHAERARHHTVEPFLRAQLPGDEEEGNVDEAAPGAERAAQAIQIPVYASLSDAQVERVARTVRRVAARVARRKGLAAAPDAPLTPL